MSEVEETDPWSTIVGQGDAVTQLRAASRAPVHAYLLVGPRGSGKRALAAAFAAALLSEQTIGDEAERHRRLAIAEQHPDLDVIEREGASINRDQIELIVRRAATAPLEGQRKVLVLDEFHLLSGENSGKLLKTIEEPPAGTFFVVLAESVPPTLITIASRCVRIDLGPVAAPSIAACLESEGVSRELADEVAAAANGDLGRARLLATDPRLALRRDAWAAVPGQLDGTGTTVTRLVDELFAMIEDAAGPLRERQEREIAALDLRVTQLGERGSGRKSLEDAHKRELRRLRTDEIRFGLLVLSRHYHSELVVSSRPAPLVIALAAIQVTSGGLVRNPNESLQLQALFLRIGRAH